MKRLIPFPLVAVVLAVSCSEITSPDPSPTKVAEPSFQVQASPVDAICSAVLPPATYQNVTVPEDASCTITGSNLTGNLKALRGSQVVATDNIILGSVHADKPRRAIIHGGSVGGSITIVEGTGTGLPGGGAYDFDVRDVAISRDIHLIKNAGTLRVSVNIFGGAGNIKVEENAIPSGFAPLFIERNSGAQNIQVFKNMGPGVKGVINNSATESIQCKENADPFFGSGNTAPKREDQCAP